MLCAKNEVVLLVSLPQHVYGYTGLSDNSDLEALDMGPSKNVVCLPRIMTILSSNQ